MSAADILIALLTVLGSVGFFLLLGYLLIKWRGLL